MLRYRLLRPLDNICRRINSKAHFPPIDLRRYVGPLSSFESSGAEFVAYLKLLAGLRPTTRFLDIGCGCGLIPLHLTEYFVPPGRYVGMDISREAIEWCQRNLARRSPSLSFIHSDIRNSRYNPNGRYRAQEYTFPFPPASFDLILLKSVFTHMRPAEVARYLHEIGRLLDGDGCCLATFFLLNDTQQRLAAEGRNAFDFRFGDDAWRYIDETSPETAVAFEERTLSEMLEQAGLRLRGPIRYGSWSGRDDGLSFQDILLIEWARGGQ